MGNDLDLLILMLAEIGSKLGVFDNYYVVDTALARLHENPDGSETMVLNLYPQWRGKFGQASCATVYMDNEFNKQSFIRCSGRDPATFTVTDTMTPPIRDPNKGVYAWENKFRPFGILMALQEESDDPRKKNKKRVMFWRDLGPEIRSSKTDPAHRGDGSAHQMDAPIRSSATPTLGVQPAQGRVSDRPAASASNGMAGAAKGSWAEAVARLGVQPVISSPEIANWVGDKIFGPERPDRGDDVYHSVLLAYESAAGVALKNGDSNKAAHAAGLAAVEVLLSALGEKE